MKQPRAPRRSPVIKACARCSAPFLCVGSRIDGPHEQRFCGAACMHTNKRLDHLTAHRYWRKVARTDDGSCWLWQGRRDKSGYGRWAKQGMHVYVHRIAWILSKGEIPAGMDVLHRCDVRNCCNPEHLFLGTHQDNMDDMWARGRARPKVHHGEEHGMAKINDQEAITIRNSPDTQRSLAQQYDLSQATVWAIKHRKIWAHLP